jgi:hypothetical protein
MFCIHCGKEIPEESTFCPFCGAAVANANQTSAAQPAEQAEAQQTQNGNTYQDPNQGGYNQNQAYGQPYNQPYQQPYGQPYQQPVKLPVNGLGIAGFVVSILSSYLSIYFCIASVVGLILSIIGYHKRSQYSYNGFALAGIIISAVTLFIWLLVWIIVGAAVIAIITGAGAGA